MVEVLFLTIALLSAAFNVIAAVVFLFWMNRQEARLAAAGQDSASGVVSRGPGGAPRGDLAVRSAFCPEAVVILCVRGHDPFLADTIRALARQDYLNYRVLVVLDHRSDPAWQVVSRVKRELGLHDGQLEIQELADRRDRCGLKCSALLQACLGLPTTMDDGQRVIVTIDSDAIPNASWLTNLVQPLVDPQVGATTSNQWFEPSGGQLGTWVRAVWQAGAIVPTAILGNPWAGSFAMRFPDLVDSGLLDAWRTSIIDDGPVRECLNRVGKRIEFVPKNMVLNREDCRLEFSFRYIARMLTWSRLFEKTFWLTGVHAALYFTTLLVLLGWCLAGTLASLFWALGWGQLPVSAVWAWTALGVWVGGQALGYELVRAAVLSHAATTARGEIRPVDGLWRLPRVVMAIPVATVAYSAGCLAALRVKRVVWRKVAYEIETGHNIKMVDYAPFASESQSAFEHHSI